MKSRYPMSIPRAAHACTFVVLAFLLAACDPSTPPVGGDAGRERGASAEVIGDVDRLRALAREEGGEETVCQQFARRFAELSLRNEEPDAFLDALHDEFLGGSGNPFEMKRQLEEGEWNQEYVYSGHGGFRPEYDDAQRYPEGGNHQPGHFVSVFSIAARFGEENARLAIVEAGDYEPGDEDDLRLSEVAIELATGLTEGELTRTEVAERVRGLCR